MHTPKPRDSRHLTTVPEEAESWYEETKRMSTGANSRPAWRWTRLVQIAEMYHAPSPSGGGEPKQGPAVTDPDQRPPRVIRLIQRPGRDGVGVFSITKNHRTYYYAFKEIPCDIGGRGFGVHRLGLANLYHVRVGAAHESSCDCLGFLSRGRCKHVHGLAALIGHKLL